MMYVLSILAGVLAVASAWFLARPLRRGAHDDAHEGYHQLLVVRDRLLTQLNEVDLEERDRNMDRDTAADERARLETELADALKQLEASAPDTQATKNEELARSRLSWRGVVATLGVALPLIATGFYFINVTVAPAEIAPVAQATAVQAGGMPDPAQMVARLEARLQQNPDDVAGWLRLGRSYVVLGRMDDAIVAYERAYPLLPRGFVADSADALWFLGLVAYRRGDGARALGFWETLLSKLPPESEDARQLKHAIAEARKKGVQRK